jgi:hypothetical protein
VPPDRRRVRGRRHRAARASNHTSARSPARVPAGTRASPVRAPPPGSVQRTVAR